MTNFARGAEVAPPRKAAGMSDGRGAAGLEFGS
jgi:hypothetical protein